MLDQPWPPFRASMICSTTLRCGCRGRPSRTPLALPEAVEEAASMIKAASITMEQARVLRYLATQLSFAVIADKLGITRSAAKDRAERLYKKLGVHSRGEAVTRARDLGIID